MQTDKSAVDLYTIGVVALLLGDIRRRSLDGLAGVAMTILTVVLRATTAAL